MVNKIFLFLLLIIAIGGAFYISLQKDTEVLVVNVALARPIDDDSAKIISNVSAAISYARRMEVPEDTPLLTPGITVIVIQNMKKKSGWYSVPLPLEESIYGSYSITVRLSDKLDHDQPVRIIARVVDPLGKDVSVKATDIRLS